MRFAKRGNSLAVRFLKALFEHLGLKTGDETRDVATGPKERVVVRNLRRQQAVERMRRRAWALPDGYAFDRTAANER